MKKWVTILIIALFLSTSINTEQTNAATNKNIIEQNQVTVVINGRVVTFKDPILNHSGSLLLPMRDYYEEIGADVSWDAKAKKAISARNGQVVELTINSKTALVNGARTQMLAAPIIYKNRTYIPMRFVSENSDGKVYWDQQKKLVEVVLNEQVHDGQSPGAGEDDPIIIPPAPDVKHTLYMNSTKITMDHEVITKDGRMYIPSSYFTNYLQGTTQSWIAQDRLELSVSGLSFIFTDNSTNIFVNNELYSGSEKPFIRAGEMYVPVKFIVDSFRNGGSLRYINESKTIYISLYDYMMTSDFLPKSYGALNVPQLVENAKLDGNRELFVSDNPEELIPTIIQNNNETLAEYKVSNVTSVKEHRVYGWHINKLGERATIGITVQNTSNYSIRVTGSKGASQTSSNSWSTFDVGLPLSDAVLTGTMRNAKNPTITIAPGETAVVESYSIGNKYLLGFTHDLDVRSVSGQPVSYTLRTVLSLDETAKLTAIHSPAVAINQYAMHPRGVWPSSAIKATLPAYTIDSAQVGYNISNGKTDNLLTAENSIDKMNGTVGNPGHFGMLYKVDVPIVNPTNEVKNIAIKITGRGGLYSGAVKMNGQSYLIPTLKPGQEYVELPVYQTSGANDVIHLEIIHAGGSNLPVAIYVETKY